MYDAQGEDLVEGDSAEGVPEEEGADEQTGDGLEQVAAAAGCGRSAHAGTWPSEEMQWVVRMGARLVRRTMKHATSIVSSGSLLCGR